MHKFWTLILFLALQCTYAQEWETSFESAATKASDFDRPLLLVFSGSDWCAPCIRFKRKIFDNKAFLDYAKDNYVLYNADFPRKKKNALPEKQLNTHKMLAERFNPRGYFPLVVVLNKNEKVLGVTDFDPKKSTEEYIRLFNDFAQ